VSLIDIECLIVIGEDFVMSLLNSVANGKDRWCSCSFGHAVGWKRGS